MIRAVIDTAALRHNLSRVRETRARQPRARGHQGECLRPRPAWRPPALAGADGFAVARLRRGGRAARGRACTQRIVLLEGVQGRRATARSRRATASSWWCTAGAARAARGLARRAPVPRSGSKSTPAWTGWDSARRTCRGASRASRPASHRCPAHALMTHLADAELRGRERPARSSSASSGDRGPAGRAQHREFGRARSAWPATRADWVRPGLMLYGISPFAGADRSGSRASSRR